MSTLARSPPPLRHKAQTCSGHEYVMPKGSQEWVEVRLQNSQASSHGTDELWDFSFQA